MNIYADLAFDRWLLELVHKLAVSAGSFFTPFFKAITVTGNMGIIFIAAALLFLCFKKTRKLGVMTLIAMALGYLCANLIIKNLVRRPRPYAVGDADYNSWWDLTGKLTDSEYSFPSGHATCSAAFAVCFIWHYGFKKSWGMIFVPLLYGLTRLYFVVHYPTDILAGLLIGTLASLAAFYLTRLLDRTKFMPKFYLLKGIEDLFSRKKKTANAISDSGAGSAETEKEEPDSAAQPKQ